MIRLRNKVQDRVTCATKMLFGLNKRVLAWQNCLTLMLPPSTIQQATNTKQAMTLIEARQTIQ